MLAFEANLAMAGYQDRKPVPRMINFYLLRIFVAYVNAIAYITPLLCRRSRACRIFVLGSICPSHDGSPINGMKLAATGRAVRLAWIERSRAELRCKARIWIGGSQYQRRHQSTSKYETRPIWHRGTILMPGRQSEDSYP